MGNLSISMVLLHYRLVVFSFLVSSAWFAPTEDTKEVADAKYDFIAAFKVAAAGEHASLAPESVKLQYEEDEEDVKKAKADFFKAFEAASSAAKMKPFLVIKRARPFLPSLYSYHYASSLGLPSWYGLGSLQTAFGYGY